MNISLYYLSVFHTTQLSPLISNSPKHIFSFFNLNNCISKYSTSMFLTNSLLFHNKINSCTFTHYLRSVFHIESEVTDVYGIHNQRMNPVSPSSSFRCLNSNFYNNYTPYNGACISITTREEVFCVFSGSFFFDNEGGIGGAIFFSSSSGNSTITNCHFSNNSAQIASHAFFSLSTLVVNDTKFQQSKGNKSSIQLTAQFTVRNSIFHFSNCHFFRNASPIVFELLLSSIDFNYCCFLNYEMTTNYPYINNFFESSNRLPFSFYRCSVNTKLLTAQNIYINQIPNYLSQNAPFGNACMLIPTPSKTNGELWNSKTGILTIFTIVFFCVVSIIGILIVSFCRCDKLPEFSENAENGFLNNNQDHLESLE